MVLRLRSFAPDGWRSAKCLGILAGSDYDPFFDDQDEAVHFCNGTYDGIVCPIRDDCLIFALTNNLREGVWGGCSELCRRVMRKRWPLDGKAPHPRWHWMSEADALKGAKARDLEPDEDDDDQGQ